MTKPIKATSCFRSAENTEEFCRTIHTAVTNGGAGIIPLIGAGMSVASGVPTVRELSEYLKYCITEALGIPNEEVPPDSKASDISNITEHWHPGRDKWPELRDKWAGKAKLCERRLFDLVNFTIDPSCKEPKIWRFKQICQEAYGAMADWRLSLQFLARLEHVEYPEKSNVHKSQTKPSGADEMNRQDQRPAFRKNEYFHYIPKVEDLLRSLTQSGEPMNREMGAFISKQIPHASARNSEVDYLAREQETRILDRPELRLGAIDDHVIDSFFNHIVAGRIPSMAHRMIVHFAHTMHTRLVLTLNFDDLMEQAFRENNIEPVVFEVHHDAGLPPWSLVFEQHTIVKLHGGRYGLRADFSLDTDPDEKDRNHFCSYLLGGDYKPSEIDPKPQARYHLLVAGISGQDRRVRALVSHALKSLKCLKVFWYCYSEQDERDLKSFFRGLFFIKSKNGKEEMNSVIDEDNEFVFIRQPNLSLLLLDVYQHITHCLPPGGLQYPTAWNMPTAPDLQRSEIKQVLDLNSPLSGHLETAKKWLKWDDVPTGRYGQPKTYSCLTITTANILALPRQASGITAFTWTLFKHWNESYKCVWIDCEDIVDLMELKIRLLQSVNCLCGLDHQTPAIYMTDTHFDKELKDLMECSGHRWIVFVNLRGSYGYIANQIKRANQSKWSTEVTDEDFKTSFRKQERIWCWASDDSDPNRVEKQQQEHEELFGKLVKKLDKSMRLVLIYEQDCPYLPKNFNGFKKDPEISVRTIPINEIFQYTPGVSTNPSEPVETRVKAALNWLMTRDEREYEYHETNVSDIDVCRSKARILRSLTLFQGARHYMAIFTPTVMKIARVDASWDMIELYLNKLVDLELIRRKPGGFLWMHWMVREYLRFELLKIVNSGGNTSKASSGSHSPTAPDLRAILFEVNDARDQIHSDIADWYMSFFHSTGDPLAVFQSVYHRCRTARLNLDDASCATDEQTILIHSQAARVALVEASNHLERARPSVISRGHFLDIHKCLDGFVIFLKHLIDDFRVKARELAKWPRANKIRKKLHRAILNSNYRNLRFAIKILIRSHIFRVWFYRDQGRSREVLTACNDYETQKAIWITEQIVFDKKQKSESLWMYYKKEWPDEAFWYDRFNAFEKALVSIPLRNYKAAEQELKALALKSRQFSIDILLSEPAERVPKLVDEWVSRTGQKLVQDEEHHRRYTMRRFMVHVFRRLMELNLIRAEVFIAQSQTSLGEKVLDDNKKTLNDYLTAAERLFAAAQLLPRYVTEEEHSHLRSEHSRLHSIMAGVLALKAIGKKPFDYRDRGIYTEINEARVALGNLPDSEESIAHDVVDLRTIYCHLAGIRRMPKLSLFRKSPFASCDDKDDSELLNEIRLIERYLDDILQIIRKIEHRMARNRKSLWWWMTLCRYKMVHIKYAMLLRRWKESLNLIPTGNYDIITAYSQDEKDAMQIMEAVSRRVTFDIYQFTFIANTLLNIANLSNEAAARHKSKGTLPHHFSISGEWHKLLKTLSELLKNFPKRPDESGDVDPQVAVYIQTVIRDFDAALV